MASFYRSHQSATNLAMIFSTSAVISRFRRPAAARTFADSPVSRPVPEWDGWCPLESPLKPAFRIGPSNTRGAPPNRLMYLMYARIEVEKVPKLPYNLSHKLHEAVITIREREPTALTSVSRIYRGDIETVVAKAMEKDKARRYASVADLAADIRRHLKDEPIVARPACVSYQVYKFARRNRALVAGVAAVFVVLLAGVTASTWRAVRARRAERMPVEQRDRGEAV